jgi:hypothetical protein
LVKYSFDKVFGNRYPYIFHAVPDASLDIAPEAIEQWKYIVNQLVEQCYPLLFSEVENGDIDAIQSIIESPQRTIFESSVKSLLHLRKNCSSF